jgi:diguanylate cyclase (GGDEF)-like protein
MRAAIVCVDDEWPILKGLADQLKRHFGKAYDIELANSGVEALGLCEELTAEGSAIPLIISDQKMSGMEGDDLLIQLHALYPKTLKIMLTGQANADSVGNVVNAAALYRYIRKPWDEKDLVLTVVEALRRFQQDQQLLEQRASLEKMNAKLESSLSLLLATLEATADGILVLDETENISSFNQKFAQIWNLPANISASDDLDPAEAIIANLIEADATSFRNLLVQVASKSHGFLRSQHGKIIEYYLQPQQLADRVIGRVWSFRDVTQEKQAEAIMRHQSLHDALTNLPNRILFNQRFVGALAQAQAQSITMAVLFLDLDRFKQVNDTFGHAMGDLLLQSVVQRLTSCLQPRDSLARWGGDEFVLLLPQIAERNDAVAVARRLIEKLQFPFLLQGHHLSVTASVGIAIYPDHGQSISILLQNADTAAYAAKQQGGNNYQYYLPPQIDA